MPDRSADQPYTSRRRPGRRTTGREHAGRGSRLLIAGLMVAVGGLGAWVVAANTVMKAQPTPLRDVAAALVAARDGAPPTLSSLKIASVTAMPDMPVPPAVTPAPAPPMSAEAPPAAALPPAAEATRTAGSMAEPSAALAVATETDRAEAEPSPTILASASAHDVTGALGASPLAAGLTDSADDTAAAPLDGAVPLPRSRPAVTAVPLPRPRPEIATEASTAPVMTLQPWEIDRNQPL